MEILERIVDGLILKVVPIYDFSQEEALQMRQV